MAQCLGATLIAAALTASAQGQTSVTLAWNPSAGTDVITNYNLYYGAASATYTNVVRAGTNTTATVSNLFGGTTYYFAATAVDTNGLESSYSTQVAYTNPVAVPPIIVLSSPASGASYAAPASISLAASVTTNGHTIVKVQFYNGATLLAADTTVPYSYSWTNVSAGSYSLTAQATYDSGSTVTSTVANVTVTNLLPPSVALTAPANGASSAAPASISLAASVTTNGHTIAKVQFYNGATLLAADTTSPYSYIWTNVSAGSYSLTAQATYDSGSTVTSAVANVTVTNLPLPVIALTGPANGASYAAPASINLAASVTTNGHTITKVQFYNGATLLVADTTSPYSYIWTNVSAGSYSLTAQATYDSGSTVTSAAVNVTVTNLPLPVIALTGPASGASYAAPASISLAASVTTNGHTITQVQFYNGATLLAADTTAPYSFTWPNVSAGSYSLTAQATYDSGSTVTSTVANVTVTNLLLPVIALTAPTNGASYVAPASISLTASVTTNGHTIARVILSSGETLIGVGTSAPYTFSWAGVSAGSYSVTAQVVYDSDSVVASAPVNVTVIPGPPVTLTSPANGANYTVPATIPLAATVITANGQTITQVQFYSGATLLGTVASAPYSLSWTNVMAGNYAVTAKAVYSTGSTVSSAAANVVVAAAGRPAGLTFASDSGTFSAPFVDDNGNLSQSVTTGVTDGGQAVYSFYIVNAGNYLVSAMVIAPSLTNNSFYVNMDTEPTDPLMIWDIPVCTNLTSETVSWRGNGDGNPASAQYIPEVFTLSAGPHQLIIVGRDANTTLGTISIAATPPTLKISPVPGGMATLTATGQPGQTYNVLASQDFVTWILIGTVTLDGTGSGQFTDPAGTSRPNCLYRLQGQ